jgi:hypothetical protein
MQIQKKEPHCGGVNLIDELIRASIGCIYILVYRFRKVKLKQSLVFDFI